MPDVHMKHPDTGDVYVVGSPSEVVRLKGRGYTETGAHPTRADKIEPVHENPPDTDTKTPPKK